MRGGLVVAIVLGPVVALANEEGTYAVTMWSCGHAFPAVLHIAPALSVVIVGAGLILSWFRWRAVETLNDSDVAVASQARFLSAVGMFACGISLLIILAQWLPLIVLDPCARG